MPRVYRQGQLRQKHKAFKGSKKNKDFKPILPGAPQQPQRKKKIRKAEIKAKKDKRQRRPCTRQELKDKKLAKKINQNSYLDSASKSRIENIARKEIPVKIVVLVPFNADADTASIKLALSNYIATKGVKQEPVAPGVHKYPYLQFLTHPKQFNGLAKQNFLFLQAPHSLVEVADMCKVADIICPILSCRSTNVQGLALDPYQNARAFDDFGYSLINILKHQGLPKIVNIVQHLQVFEHSKSHQDKVLKLFRRYFVSEFGDEEKILTINANKPEDVFTFLRALQNTAPASIPWRENRGYLLAEEVTYDAATKQLTVAGFLKGECVNPNQLVHITGLDDFEVSKIEILPHKFTDKRSNQKATMDEEDETMVQYATAREEIYAFHKTTYDPEQLTNAFEGLALSKPLMQTEEEVNKIDIEGQENAEDQDEGEELNEEELFNFREDEKKKRIEMHLRDADEMEFEDEVEYGPDVNVRERYSKYRGLASFKNTQWNPLENLPDEYGRIFVFKNYQKTYKTAVEQNKQRGFAYPGFYIKVVIENVPLEPLQKRSPTSPLIISFLLKHERKMTTVHLRMRRNPYHHDPTAKVVSKQQYEVNMGFRRVYVNPIFSRVINNCDKTKYRKSFVDFENYYYCSFYYYNTFPPAFASIYRMENGMRDELPIMTGDIIKCDPLHVILKRIILTGYPFKINRRRSTVRFMFFNPKDVKYFKPVQLITKLGLRGEIQESLGTHGYMKCFFNDSIKPHDTVCLYLYKRVFPKLNF